ncbi:MAG: hypothetical protein AAFO95_15230, partial [Cyanobacteria bacterium J06600_6]
MRKFFTSFISGIIAIFFLHSTQYFWMMLGLPSFLAAAIAWILVLEIITKLMLLKAVPPFVVNQTSLEAHSHLVIISSTKIQAIAAAKKLGNP